MKRLRVERLWIMSGCLGAIAALSGNFAALAVIPPSFAPANADGMSLPPLVRSPMDGNMAQRNRNCRRIVADVFIPFNNVADSGTAFGDLAKGDKVELMDGTNTVLGVDGRSYIRVRFPYIESSYNRARQETGYIPTRYQTYGGEMRSTLGACSIRALW